MMDSDGNIYSYHDLMLNHNFQVIHKEFLSVIKAIPNGLVHLMCHLTFGEIVKTEPTFKVGDKSIYDPKCNNKMIRNIFSSKKRVTPRGKFF